MNEIQIDSIVVKPNTNYGIIHYGFGRDYLPNWEIQQALREIYQNFLDYGDYEEEVQTNIYDNSNLISVTLTNGWNPIDLNYLRVGNSNKGNNPNAIGKHGEGLKMAFLILEREKLQSSIMTSKYEIYPSFYNDSEIGECFCFKYHRHDLEEFSLPYRVSFEIQEDDFYTFKNNLIKPEDIIYTNDYYGDIVDKEKGNIYSGGLFVANIGKLSQAYNIKPEHLSLDRDRSMPSTFDVNWAAGRILEGYEKWNATDTSYSDTQFINKIPDKIVKDFEPKIVGNSLQFIIKDEEGNDKVVPSGNVKDALTKHSFFQEKIKQLKLYIMGKLGLYELLLEFKQKHVKTVEAIQDFEIILERVEK